MRTCDGHGDQMLVVYEGQDCPLCEAEARIGELEEANEELRDETTRLTAELDDRA